MALTRGNWVTLLAPGLRHAMAQGQGPFQAAMQKALAMGAPPASLQQLAQQFQNQIAQAQMAQQQNLIVMNQQQFSQLQNQMQQSGQLAPFFGQNTVPVRQPGVLRSHATLDEDTTLFICGEYLVRRSAGQSFCTLLHSLRGPLITFVHTPSRSSVAAAIRDDRARRPRKNARDDFGTLVGVRVFVLTEDLHLQSPAMHTVWQTNVLVAEHWEESAAVRGTCGIHAAWPCMSSRVMPYVDSITALPSCVLAHVRGMQRFVAGEEGWRAEKVIVDKVYLPAHIRHRWRYLKRLERLYPAVEFEEEPWTLERSSRSARSSR